MSLICLEISRNRQLVVEAIGNTDDVNKIDGYRAVRQRKISWFDSLESTLLFITVGPMKKL